MGRRRGHFGPHGGAPRPSDARRQVGLRLVRAGDGNRPNPGQQALATQAKAAVAAVSGVAVVRDRPERQVPERFHAPANRKIVQLLNGHGLAPRARPVALQPDDGALRQADQALLPAVPAVRNRPGVPILRDFPRLAAGVAVLGGRGLLAQEARRIPDMHLPIGRGHPDGRSRGRRGRLAVRGRLGQGPGGGHVPAPTAGQVGRVHQPVLRPPKDRLQAAHGRHALGCERPHRSHDPSPRGRERFPRPDNPGARPHLWREQLRLPVRRRVRPQVLPGYAAHNRQRHVRRQVRRHAVRSRGPAVQSRLP